MAAADAQHGRGRDQRQERRQHDQQAGDRGDALGGVRQPRLVARQTDQGLVLRRPRLDRLDDLDGVHHRPGEQTAEVIDLDVLVGEDPLGRRDAGHVERADHHADGRQHRVEGEHHPAIDDDHQQADDRGRERAGDQVGHGRVAVHPAGDVAGVTLLVERRRQPQDVPDEPRRVRRRQRLLQTRAGRRAA